MRRYAAIPPLLLAAVALALAAAPAAAQPEWQSDTRCRVTVDSLPAAYARCGTVAGAARPGSPRRPDDRRSSSRGSRR